MSYDVLLTYLSDVGHGSWMQFKRALNGVQGSVPTTQAAQAARVLSALGHAEFTWASPTRWAICPPALVALPRRRQPCAVLCGMRSPTLLTRIATWCDEHALDYASCAQSGGPSIITITAHQDEELVNLAATLDITWADQAVEYLAGCVPALLALLALAPRSPIPVVPPTRVWYMDSIAWQETDAVKGDGLYQFASVVPDYRLFFDGMWREVPKEVGIYALTHRRVWSYAPDEHILRIPVGMLPPPLYQRVLTLCSGSIATFDITNRLWVYHAVPPAVAVILAQKLGQSLEDIC